MCIFFKDKKSKKVKVSKKNPEFKFEIKMYIPCYASQINKY